MWGHPGEERLIELAEGAGQDATRAHVSACAACAAQVEELRVMLGSLRAVDVPEPSPLYWEAFRRQVARRIDAPRTTPTSARWWWLPALAASLGLAVVVVPRPWGGPTPATSPSSAAVTLPAWAPLPTVEDDEGFEVLQALASTGALASVGECQDLTECAAELGEQDADGLAQALSARGGQS